MVSNPVFYSARVGNEMDDEDETEVAAKPVAIDIVNEFASKLRSLSVHIGELGPDFCEVSRYINDNTDEL